MLRGALLAATMLLVALPIQAAPPGTAQNFLNRAERLKAKGPLALFDGDFRRLKNEAVAAGTSIRLEREAAERAGRPILYCSPRPRAELGQSEFLRGLEAIPAAERQRITLRAAMLRILQQKYPCRSQPR